MDPLIETWQIANRLNSFLLAGINESFLSDQLGGKGRTVAEQFAHLHQVRLMWLHAAAPDLETGLSKFEKGKSVSVKMLEEALAASGSAIAQLLERGLTDGRIKGFKPHPQAFIGYLIAHEAHHRGQIIATLKANGHLPDKKTLFGLWEWGVR